MNDPLPVNLEPNGANKVLVFSGEHDVVEQPGDFRCCPLGIQLYSQEDIPQYKVMDIGVNSPTDEDAGYKIECTGVVVHSQYEDECKMYRVWVMFLDLPEEARQDLLCVSKEQSLTCPFCENF